MLKSNKVIPIFRVFDYRKTIEYYVDWLGFKVDWEHRFDDNSPIYMQVSMDTIVLHLSEHHGDCCPGSKAFIECTGIREYHKQLLAKKYKYNSPGLEVAPWKALCMEVIDPFGNKLLFSEAQ
ncbi:glyoxalase superfamily protein [Negadavirga shengliensis]|uniref:Bleomycin resistance protein n=1 Tax=Negadavirga shengliensis TaxID=1389218 RepID=A0ABV9SZS5_9BACT